MLKSPVKRENRPVTPSTMASNKNPRKNKDTVVNNLRDLFGGVLHIDIIRSVASQCDFDVQRSSNALLEMTNNIGERPLKKTGNNKNKVKKSSQNTTPVKKVEQVQSPRAQINKSKKTLELERVVNNIRLGYKILVILRGLPGSGKSRLALTITDVTLGPGNNSHHVLSADDFFNQGGGYAYDPLKLQDAHAWNHKRAFQAMSRGLSPVIIDNTNTQMWEMKAYAGMATDYGYIIEILEPDTCWAFNEKELAKKNVHGVPKAKIRDMLDRYERNVTPQKLLLAYNLIYKFQKPPQYRLFPPIIQNGYSSYGYPQPLLQNNFACTQSVNITKSRSTPTFLNRQQSRESDLETINLMDFTDNQEAPSQEQTSENYSTYVNPVDEILMCAGDSSCDILQPNQVGDEKDKVQPFPDIENAWGIDEKALQSWDIVTPIVSSPDIVFSLFSSNQEEANKPETKDGWSIVEGRDFLKDGEISPSGLKVLTTESRDINIGSPIRSFTIPKRTMIDQSCITEDLVEGESDESRINDLLDLFPRIPKSSLQELFNRCNKNFSWTVDLLLEDENLEVTETTDNEIFVVADSNDQVMVVEEEEDDDVVEAIEELKEAKVFKNKPVSGDSLELKKCLEGKFDINKEHYSEHVLKVKQSKFGCYQDVQDSQPSTSAMTLDLDSDIESVDSDHSDDDPKNMIELNLGDAFVAQLETMFGADSVFPKGFQPVVQMPRTLAQQIYSFYVESVCQQMEAQNHILDRLVKEDEEFARKLQDQDVPQRQPNLMEIMDEQVAMNLHKRDVDDWKNMTADNLAIRLTKQKLFSSFPNIDKDSLLEIWHAYDYDYNKTVKDLMASVGPDHVQGSTDTIREPPLSNTTLQEMKEAEEDCAQVEESEEQKPATYYREEANKHLRRREELYEKARSYCQRGMTEVAMFYSELAKKETNSYDKANYIAATVFAEEHSKRLEKFDTLDLHYLYVREAIPNLDIFIDRNINLLKGGAKRGQDLFVITGRGKNSRGGKCKIKPAVINRLQKRNIGYVQLNPGLLKIRVMKNSLMTSDLP